MVLNQGGALVSSSIDSPYSGCKPRGVNFQQCILFRLFLKWIRGVLSSAPLTSRSLRSSDSDQNNHEAACIVLPSFRWEESEYTWGAV